MNVNQIRHLKQRIWNGLASGLIGEKFYPKHKLNLLARKHPFGLALVCTVFVDHGTRLLTRIHVAVRYDDVQRVIFPEEPHVIASFGVGLGLLCGVTELEWPSNDDSTADWAVHNMLDKLRKVGIPFLNECSEIDSAPQAILRPDVTEFADCLQLYLQSCTAVALSHLNGSKETATLSNECLQRLSRRCKPQAREFLELLDRIGIDRPKA